MRAMHHIDKGARDCFRVSDQWRNYSWQSICSKMEHLSDEGADVLAMNPAAKSSGEKKQQLSAGPQLAKAFQISI